MSCNKKNEWLTFKIKKLEIKNISKKISFKDQLKFKFKVTIYKRLKFKY